MRITTKGQVTIPRHIREHLGLLPHTEVRFLVEGDGVKLQKVTAAGDRARELVHRLRGMATVRITTDEILALTRDATTAGTSPRRVRSSTRARSNAAR